MGNFETEKLSLSLSLFLVTSLQCRKRIHRRHPPVIVSTDSVEGRNVITMEIRVVVGLLKTAFTNVVSVRGPICTKTFQNCTPVLQIANSNLPSPPTFRMILSKRQTSSYVLTWYTLRTTKPWDCRYLCSVARPRAYLTTVAWFVCRGYGRRRWDLVGLLRWNFLGGSEETHGNSSYFLCTGRNVSRLSSEWECRATVVRQSVCI